MVTTGAVRRAKLSQIVTINISTQNFKSFLSPNQQCHGIEGKSTKKHATKKSKTFGMQQYIEHAQWQHVSVNCQSVGWPLQKAEVLDRNAERVDAVQRGQQRLHQIRFRPFSSSSTISRNARLVRAGRWSSILRGGCGVTADGSAGAAGLRGF